MAITCWAPGCYHNNKKHTCNFYRFPKDIKLCKKWLTLLRRDAQPGSGARVCSCHFKDGKKENNPEILSHNENKLFHEHYLSPERKRPRRELITAVKRTLDYDSVSSEEPSAALSRKQHEIGGSPEEPQAGPSCEMTEAEPVSVATKTDRDTASSSIILESENTPLLLEIEKKDQIIQTLRNQMTYLSICESDKLILEYTGLPTRLIFDSLIKYIEKVEINYHNKWKVYKLDKTDQMLMTLMKLRQNFSHIDLAFRFNVSEATVTNIVTTYIHVLFEALYENLMAKIPTRHKNKSCLPSCFNNFTNCRMIIDCTEIFCTVPRQSMKKQRLTYSSYKHRNTCKGLVGVSPNGVITFVSCLYPGSTSDKNIVKHSGILNNFEPGDLILADKGFLIKDLLPAGVSLNIPPYLSTPQFTTEQINQTKCIAKARIHVERAIRRMKTYNILNMIPERLFPHASVIFKTVASLTNLQYPLIKEVSEFYVDVHKEPN